jgi:hypothetical protein
MPFSFSDHVPHFAKRFLVGVGDQHVGGALHQALDNPYDLRPRLAGAEDDFGKSLSRRPGVVHSRVADVFVMKISDPARGLVRVDFIPTVRAQEFFYFFHVLSRDDAWVT